MNMRDLKIFTVGVLITAIAVGSISYVNAASDSPIKACANKSTGAMRLLTKGSCKKTETAVSWNQIGPQGQPGATGIAGASGGTVHALYAVDANGTTIGEVTGNIGSRVNVLVNGLIWELESAGTFYDITASGSANDLYANAACDSPYFLANGVKSAQGIAIDRGNNDSTDLSDKAYIPIGSPLSWASIPLYKWRWNNSTSSYQCSSLTSQERTDYANGTSVDKLYATQEVTKPTYTPPLRIVAQ